MTRQLVLWFDQRTVGDFTQRDDGRQQFVYRDSWRAEPESIAISLALPLQAEAFGDRETRAFFGGLLPDDEARQRLARHLQVSARNEFALLAEVGRECAGALALYPPDEVPPPPATTPPATAIDDEAFVRLLRDLPQRPLLAGRELRLSLAGAQDKIAVIMHDSALALPHTGQPTTHILKVPIANFDATVANECFAMRLAARAGLPVPATTMRVLQGMPILLVERFDRVRGNDGVLRRRHQEDFCQALGVPPDRKYQGEGGPGLPAMFELLTRHSSRPAVDRLLLLQMVVFHFLLGNADAHAKNFSLLLGPNEVRLAPVYDALCTLVYESLAPRLAMKIDTRYAFDEVTLDHWAKFATAVGLSPPVVRDRLGTMAAQLPDHARAVRNDDPLLAAEPLLDRVIGLLEARCASVLDGLGRR